MKLFKDMPEEPEISPEVLQQTIKEHDIFIPDKEYPKEEEIGKLIFIYGKLIIILKKYVDLKEEYYKIVVLWIIGTYLHDKFSAYPYLFFNAIKGSGKTRLLNLIAYLSKNGKLVSNMSEAVLFRTAKGRTLCIDEFERITSKEKLALRELLNSAYKKGMSVERVYKTKTQNPETKKMQEKYEIESFDVYCPITMANIWGLEDVLSDRCITLILEKSTKKEITRLIELFDEDLDIKEIKRTFSVGSVVSDAPTESIQVCLSDWNEYIIHTTIDTTDTTDTTNTTDTTDTKKIFFNKIRETTLEGRSLELFFPLFLIAWKCGVLEETIKTAEEIVKSKKEEDVTESRDISFLNFLANKPEEENFIPLRKLVQEFKEEEEDWVTSEWIGRALKRLGLIIEKKRVARGREVKINFKKAQEKIKIFK